MIRQTMEYGSYFYINASQNLLNKLNSLQHQFINHFTHNMSSSSQAINQLLSQIPPLHFRRIQESIKLYLTCYK